MIHTKFFTFKFYIFAQSGFYFDFFSKKICEIFIRNILIYSSQFFGEKFLIEFFTKTIFYNFFFYTNQILEVLLINYESFFYKFILTIFIFLTILQIIIIIL